MDIIEQLANYGKTWFRLTKSHVRLFVLELKLAKASIIPLIITLVFLSILIACTWVSLLAFIGYEIYIHTQSLFWALMSVFLINLFCLLVVGIIALIYMRQISFKRTRSNLQSYGKSELHHENEPT